MACSCAMIARSDPLRYGVPVLPRLARRPLGRTLPATELGNKLSILCHSLWLGVAHALLFCDCHRPRHAPVAR